MRKQYKDWNTAIRAIKNQFGDGVKGVTKGSTLNFINVDIRNNKLILTNKGKRFLETYLNKSKQPNIPNAPSTSIFQLPPPHSEHSKHYSTIDSELKNYKDRLLLSLKENDYWSKKDAEHEAEIMSFIEMMKSGTNNETALQKQISYLNERNKELQDQLDFYSGSENILSLTSKSKELL